MSITVPATTTVEKQGSFHHVKVVLHTAEGKFKGSATALDRNYAIECATNKAKDAFKRRPKVTVFESQVAL